MKKYESELMGSLHETASGLHKIGVISDNEMYEYDRECIISNFKPSSESKNIPEQKPTPVYANHK